MRLTSLRATGVAVVAVLLASGGLASCGSEKGLTDDPLTDSEVSAFFTDASETMLKAHHASLASAVDSAGQQRAAIEGAYASLVAAQQLAAAKDAAQAALAELQGRADAVTASYTAEEKDTLDNARSAVDAALNGKDPSAIAQAVDAYRQAIEDIEAAIERRAALTVTPPASDDQGGDGAYNGGVPENPVDNGDGNGGGTTTDPDNGGTDNGGNTTDPVDPDNGGANTPAPVDPGGSSDNPSPADPGGGEDPGDGEGGDTGGEVAP